MADLLFHCGILQVGFDDLIHLMQLFSEFLAFRRYNTDFSIVEIDLVVVRENTEDLYAGIEFEKGKDETAELINWLNKHNKRQIGSDSGISIKPISVKATEKIVRFAFEYAREKGRKKVTSVTKSNAQRYGMVLWDKIFKEVSSRFPGVQTESKLIDAACMDVVRNPKGYDVIVASNLFADILSDLTASVTGGMGLAPGASFNPKDKSYPGFFRSGPWLSP
jgi:isocitrate dehydrogenase (NAD+)